MTKIEYTMDYFNSKFANRAFEVRAMKYWA